MRTAPAVTGAVLIVALGSGCRAGAGATTSNQAQAAPAVAAPPSPQQRAQRMVAQQLKPNGELRFGDAQSFTSAGATIVCGRYRQGGENPQRYIAVGEDDVFVEPHMQAGHMDQAVTEFCRNG